MGELTRSGTTNGATKPPLAASLPTPPSVWSEAGYWHQDIHMDTNIEALGLVVDIEEVVDLGNVLVFCQVGTRSVSTVRRWGVGWLASVRPVYVVL